MTRRQRILFGLALVTITGAALAYSPNAQAQCGSYGGGYGRATVRFGYGGYSRYTNRSFYSSRSYRAPIYHSPSVHYDRVYHQDYLHWTPNRGIHGHGHIDTVRHFVPGHVGTLHNGHIDANRRFHH